MPVEGWQKIEQILHDALQREEAQRAAFLEDACAGDLSLRSEVESLLAHEHGAEEFMNTPALEVAAKALVQEQAAGGVAAAGGGDLLNDPLIGKRIGSYRLVELIGSGGMGAVYLAERDDNQFQKQVAIKLICSASWSPGIARRFRDERQILARLDHPNIARLLDAGTTDSGLPYFMMEYVEGQPIHQYCDDRRLSIRERLELFRTVCSAVQYAHQNLVIHRDIKPGNILVTANGVPKLLDFGIAKFVDPTSPGLTGDSTATGPRLMTPEYASPEQLCGEPITTSTDVYSLGVLLYELLTGHKPHTLNSPTPHEIAKAICENEPQRPSLAITRLDKGASSSSPSPVSHASQSVLRELQRRLAGDLDNIVLTAIKTDPRRRYGSVEQFSEDIRRHIEGFPVLAGKDTVIYRAGKFIRRNTASVLAVLVILMTLIVGIAGTAWQAHIASVQRARAEQRFNDVRKLANSFMFDLEDEIQGLPGSTHAQEKLLKTALQYLDSMARESKDDPSLQSELAAAYQRVGDIEGRRGTQNLGNTAAALESYRKTLDIREALAAAFPADTHSQNQLAMIHDRIATLLELRNDIAGALEHNYKALKLDEAASRANPADRKALNDLGTDYSGVARHLLMQADWAGALKNDLKALAIFENLATTAPPDNKVRYNLAVLYDQVAYELNKTGDRARALEYCAKARAISENLAAIHPHDIHAQLDLCSTYQYQATLLFEAGDFEKSLDSWRKALGIAQAAAAADPNDSRAKISLASVLNSLGWLMVKAGKTTDVEYIREGLEIREKFYATDPTNPRRKDIIGNSYVQLGEAEAILGMNPRIPPARRTRHWREARSWYQRAFEIYNDLRAKGALRGKDSGEPDRIAREIAKCDAALVVRR
jgi:non-specific serine/threonine protein kinase/serine/threonine-protein kinase